MSHRIQRAHHRMAFFLNVHIAVLVYNPNMPTIDVVRVAGVTRVATEANPPVLAAEGDQWVSEGRRQPDSHGRVGDLPLDGIDAVGDRRATHG